MATDGELSDEDAETLERVIGSGAPAGIGTFRYLFADQRWEWSPEVARMHGYEPGAVRPTTELLLSHKHPEDRDRVRALITSVEDGAPFSSSHRIIDTAGRVHHVTVLSYPLYDASGDRVGTGGYYIDLTAAVDAEQRRVIDDRLPQWVAAGAEIEQAKGALMLVYGIPGDQATRLLLWRARETGTPLRALCIRLTAELTDFARADSDLRRKFDHILLTVHERVESD
ncbi:PAS and ANTAR domain-containing protein [Nocardia sp. CDC159]|uniref:PAS and ANTAR domain-containing protein n=1 Tax=Nocardia pulmonis TaxID=2951408 RepID=A0A9X2E6V2_9NOCA|nr:MULTISPECIES: PAS and ANTAR domain-containing protein [Nocardia]MCM6774243.1 PAS and ANTAR domain-containing protein [Nocardia pulmonis]MCM6787130.1 PAS and ANTAR domain-containing protein [Nocardia sp. CDC159]